MGVKPGEKRRKDGQCCACPFCDATLEPVYPFCRECGKKVNYCSKCGKPIPPTKQVCDDCAT
ncbi:MAG TPA: hypothetical protein ENI46_01825 [Firmicutes bacterium]|nr:hypothetical protein [Bacillota bacterium]